MHQIATDSPSQGQPVRLLKHTMRLCRKYANMTDPYRQHDTSQPDETPKKPGAAEIMPELTFKTKSDLALYIAAVRRHKSSTFVVCSKHEMQLQAMHAIYIAYDSASQCVVCKKYHMQGFECMKIAACRRTIVQPVTWLQQPQVQWP